MPIPLRKLDTMITERFASPWKQAWKHARKRPASRVKKRWLTSLLTAAALAIPTEGALAKSPKSPKSTQAEKAEAVENPASQSPPEQSDKKASKQDKPHQGDKPSDGKPQKTDKKQDTAESALFKPDSIKLHGRIQTGWQLTGDTNTGSWSDSLFLRRARIGAKWAPLDWAKLNLEFKLDLTGLAARDMYAEFDINHWFDLSVGYFKKPFSRLRMSSSFDVPIPERGLLDENVVKTTKYGGFGNRDLGLMVSGDVEGPTLWRDPLKLSYALGLFNNLPTESNYHRDIAARAQLRLFKGLVVAADGSFKFYQESSTAKSASMLGADLKWELGDFRLQLEGAVGDNVNLGSRLWGAHTILSYEIPLAGLNQPWMAEWVLTPAIMAEVFDPDVSANDDLDLRLAAALNLDLNRNLRVVLGLDRTWSDIQASSSAIPDPVRLVLQTNLRF